MALTTPKFGSDLFSGPWYTNTWESCAIYFWGGIGKIKIPLCYLIPNIIAPQGLPRYFPVGTSECPPQIIAILFVHAYHWLTCHPLKQKLWRRKSRKCGKSQGNLRCTPLKLLSCNSGSVVTRYHKDRKDPAIKAIDLHPIVWTSFRIYLDVLHQQFFFQDP